MRSPAFPLVKKCLQKQRVRGKKKSNNTLKHANVVFLSFRAALSDFLSFFFEVAAFTSRVFCVFVIQMKWRRRKWQSGESPPFDSLECLPPSLSPSLPPARRRHHFFLCVSRNVLAGRQLWRYRCDVFGSSSCGKPLRAQRRPFGRGRTLGLQMLHNKI